MNMSFINRASPHEVLSFFTQPIYPSAKDWLSMDLIQSAIMTSSLINLPLAGGELGFQCAVREHTHMHTDMNVAGIRVHFFFVSGIMGKFLDMLVKSEISQQQLDGLSQHLEQSLFTKDYLMLA